MMPRSKLKVRRDSRLTTWVVLALTVFSNLKPPNFPMAWKIIWIGSYENMVLDAYILKQI